MGAIDGTENSRLLLVDGHNLLFQMFYGMPSRIVNGAGKPIQGTLGFVGALLKIIRMTQPSHVAVIFDGERGSKRTALNPDYKANRPDYSEVADEDNPFVQLPDVYAALDFMGIRHAETDGCEADDVIAGYARTLGEEMEVVISSFDSDFFQLITDRVSVLRYRGEKTVLCTPTYIHERLGIEPEQYADYKSLTGDAADNIRGADHIGPKTASALLRQFGSLQGILAGCGRIAKPSVCRSVSESRERLLMNHRLIALAGCAQLPFSLADMAYADSGFATRDVLSAIGLW